MTDKNLNLIEVDFIEFIAKKKNRTFEDISKKYLKLRERFKFDTNEFKELALEIYDLNSLYYTDETDSDLIESYKQHSFMHLLRFISYEKIASQSSNPFKKVKTAARLIKKLEISYFIRAVKGKFSEKKEAHVHDFTGISGYLLSKMDSPVEVVVDYGCGPAFISFELSKQVAERSKNSLITYLVDIDTLILEFAKFRFRKYGLKVETIVVTNEDMYPKLPKHDICIVTEVLEHVPKPEEVAKNIVSSLNLNGLLYGSLDDHTAHTFHISPDLQKVRDLLDGANVLEIGPMLRKAVSVAE